MSRLSLILVGAVCIMAGIYGLLLQPTPAIGQIVSSDVASELRGGACPAWTNEVCPAGSCDHNSKYIKPTSDAGTFNGEGTGSVNCRKVSGGTNCAANNTAVVNGSCSS